MLIRTLFIIPLVLMSLVSPPSWGLTFDDLVQREGLFYKKFTDVPFTGEIDEGLKRGNFKNGKEEGPWVGYYEDGQLDFKGNYKNGEKEGPWLYYYDDGRLFQKENFKKGKLEGAQFSYWNNGQLWMKGDLKNGEQEGPWVGYYEDGQLDFKGNYKNGEKEGPWVFFEKDGTKRVSTKGLYQGSGVYRGGVKVSD